MDFIKNLVDFLKNEEKSFIIYSIEVEIDFINNLVDFLNYILKAL